MGKKFFAIVLIGVIIFLIAVIAFNVTTYISMIDNMKYDNMSATMTAVVVKVDETDLWVIAPASNSGTLKRASIYNTGNIGFKKGQEILIYYGGFITSMSPPSISNIGKIEITKEESDVEIPINILRYCYSSKDNVSVTINEFTNEKISISITDTNEYPYDYSNDYISIDKYENGLQIEEIELNEISSNTKENTTTKEYEWKITNAMLESGKYKLRFNSKNSEVEIEIDFTIDENRNISFSEPKIS